MNERPLVIGVGNELRGDDGAGIAVVRRLRETGDVDVRELQGEPTTLLEIWQGRDAVVLIDTMRSGARPGAIRRIDASQAPLPEGLGGSTSTHAVGVGETLELARTIRRLPGQVVVYAIEGRRFETGDDLSDEVRAAVPRVVAMVLGEAGALPRIA